jgi:thiosulfate reductase cytochrome b subunit
VSASSKAVRQGLPRVPGGAPWPPLTMATAAVAQDATEVAPMTEILPSDVLADETTTTTAMRATATATVPAERSGPGARQGLPRVPGGEPWPPLTTAMAAATATGGAQPVSPAASPGHSPDGEVCPEERGAPLVVAKTEPVHVQPLAGVEGSQAAAVPPSQLNRAVQPAAPTSTEESGKAPAAPTSARTAWRLARWVLLAVAAGGVIVLAARGVTTLPGVPEFMAAYPGEYPLPDGTAPGFPVWARWSHFLNFFFMVLIVKTGLAVRHQQRPPAFYTPRRGGKKVSIYLWLHTSLDVLWLVNGIVFVVLLFASGQWVRIVPTSWSVFPNAASALLQYLTMDWPVENGWVNFNSLQQLMYFLVVFVAAPLAAVTGVRMSDWWPQDAPRLNRAYPAGLARAVHFPTMLFFVAFVVVHVFLVFATGPLRNLNHMFAGNDQAGWAGFLWFVAGLLVSAGATFAARPLLLAPLASVSGTVSGR